MDVILLEKQTMGNLGERVSVKAGYARNYLFPNGKAVAATEENIKKFEERRAELEKAQAEVLAKADARAAKLNNLVITIKANASDDGKLYGSIGTRNIAEAINAATGEEVKKSEVLLPNGTLHQIGEFDIQIQLHADVSAIVKLDIVAEA
jgi:large subunit ribosomal protein L9